MKISMKSVTIATALAYLAIACNARAEMVIAYTSFEEPVVPLVTNPIVPELPPDPTTSYTDPGNAAVDHALANVNDGQNMPVNYTSVGGELGFIAFYTNSRNSQGLTDGDSAGVLRDFPSLTDQILDPTDGVQQYVLSDLDGRVTVTLDSVDLTGFVSPRVSLDFWFQSSSYELDDYAHIWVEIDDGGSMSQITLLDTRPDDIDTLDIENLWHTLSAALPTGTIATLKFEADTESAAEKLGVDNIRFTAVPEPGAFMLFALGGVALFYPRWRPCSFSLAKFLAR